METSRRSRTERLQARLDEEVWNQYRQGFMAQSGAEAIARLPLPLQLNFMMSIPKEEWTRDYLRVMVQKELDYLAKVGLGNTLTARAAPTVVVEGPESVKPEFKVNFVEAAPTLKALDASLRAVERALRGIQTDSAAPLRAVTQTLEGLVQRFEARTAQPPEVRSGALQEAAQRLGEATRAIADVKAFYEEQWSGSIAKTVGVVQRLEALETRLTARVEYLEQFDAVRTLAERKTQVFLEMPSGHIALASGEAMNTVDPTYDHPSCKVPGQADFRVGDRVVVLGRDRLNAGRIGNVVRFTDSGTPSSYAGMTVRAEISHRGKLLYAYTHDCIRFSPDMSLDAFRAC